MYKNVTNTYVTYYQRNKELISAKSKEYYQKNKDRLSIIRQQTDIAICLKKERKKDLNTTKIDAKT